MSNTTDEAIAAHKDALADLIADYVKEHPGAGYLDVAIGLGLSPSTTWRYFREGAR